MICPSCKKQVELGSWFCPFCAAQLESDAVIKTATLDKSVLEPELTAPDAVVVDNFITILEPEETFPDSSEVSGMSPVPPALDPSLLVEVVEVVDEARPRPKITPHPDRAELLHRAAVQDRETGNFASARMNMKLAIALDPDNQEYATLYVDLLAEKPAPSLIDHVGAQQLFDDAARSESAGDHERAIVTLEKALKLSRHPIVLNRLGVLYASKRRDFAKSKELLEAAVEAAPHNLAYVQNLNKVLARVEPDARAKENLWQRMTKKKT